ncbi:unnamed protein product, partial [Cyprideis torosa]
MTMIRGVGGGRIHQGPRASGPEELASPLSPTPSSRLPSGAGKTALGSGAGKTALGILPKDWIGLEELERSKGRRHSTSSVVMTKCFEKIKYIQLEKLHKATSEEERESIIVQPREIFHRALHNCSPVLVLTSVKRGGQRYQVPVPVRREKAEFLATRWLIQVGKDKDRQVTFPEKLAWELLEASQNEGRTVKRKQDLHRQCEANKAFAHYRWAARKRRQPLKFGSTALSPSSGNNDPICLLLVNFLG